MSTVNSYAELHVHSYYSFLDGASSPEELVDRAVELELSGIALTDHDGLPGIVRFARHARSRGIPTIFGSEITLAPDSGLTRPRTNTQDPQGRHLVVLARDAEGYRRLSRAISHGKLQSGHKDAAIYSLEALAQEADGHWQILTGCRKGYVRTALEPEPGIWDIDAAQREISILAALFGADNVAVELEHNSLPMDDTRNRVLAQLAADNRMRTVATNNVHTARPQGKQLADILSAIRAGKTLHDIEPWLAPWSGFIKSLPDMERTYGSCVQAVYNAGAIGQECAFDLQLVAPRLPPFSVPEGYNENTWLRHLVEEAGIKRYGERGSSGYAQRAWQHIDHELQIITQLDFAGYFLIVHDIVEFCRHNGILCQGRGSAANSAVCFALGITAVDAVKHQMLFERFLSPDRIEPPDIDLDIEARERERVIQYVYNRCGREHAAQVANIITYRRRSALRDVGKVLGYSENRLDTWAKEFHHHPNTTHTNSAIPRELMRIVSDMRDLPRHRGIHSGGMVICDRPVIDVCPVEWARKSGRSVVQWDKDDCADAGLVKFDLLGLGMLTALRLAFTSLAHEGVTALHGEPLGLHNLPDDDPRVYDLLCAADTVGVFQVESRAQMATLPRIRPRTFYDIVIEVALIRPGPIQGGSVNPYIRRRRGEEEVTYIHPLLRSALEKTLGIPLFQEQLMRIAIDAAGFTPAQADQLRKAMGSKRSHDQMEKLKSELMEGMHNRGIPCDDSEKIYEKLQAFADFGFPESHAFSFAYLVYASAWLKVHHPEHFYVGLLGAQPMGFYSVNTLIHDAKRHGVTVLPIDVNYSDIHSQVEDITHDALPPETRSAHHVCRGDEHMEKDEHVEREVTSNVGNVADLVDADSHKAIRLGLSNIKALNHAVMQLIVSERKMRPFSDLPDLSRRCRLSETQVEALARADALRSIGTSMQAGIWESREVALQGKKSGVWFQPIIPGMAHVAEAPELPTLSLLEKLHNDLVSTGLSPRVHVMEECRDMFTKEGVLSVEEAVRCEHGQRVKLAGVVTHRQRPHTAAGITFLSLEDETGLANIVCSVGLWKVYGDIIMHNQLIIVRGIVEKGQDVVNIKADKVRAVATPLPLASRDFR
ncbi:MAG: error-prone DNA polymerase [Arcanobacterium sp.]|nr:error-prone DNA polymerase [Arcanobacterium sp.]